MPHLREAVFDPVLATNTVEDLREGVRIQGEASRVFRRLLFMRRSYAEQNDQQVFA
jgi:hypothetical protein